MDSSDESDSITIVGDAFQENNIAVVINDSNGNRMSSTANNSLPYKCKLCGRIYDLLEQVKNHYESIHIADKAVMCKLEADELYDYNHTPLSDESGDDNQVDDPCTSDSFESCVDGSTVSSFPDESSSNNFHDTSPSDVKTAENDFGIDQISKLKNCVKKRKPGRPKGSTINKQSKGKLPSRRPLIVKKVVTEVRKELVPVSKINDWYTNHYPLRTPYYPQIGDHIDVSISAYKNFEDQLTKNCPYLEKQKFPADVAKLHQITATVCDIKFTNRNYETASPFIIHMTLELIDRDETVDLWWCNIPMPDFVVLKKYNKSGDWLVGDRFRTLLNQAWWLGTITKYTASFAGNIQSWFHCFEVTYDTGDSELLSPWDLFKENTTRKPKKFNAGVPLYTDELHLLLYSPDEEEWPKCGRDAECQRITEGLKSVLVKVADLLRNIHSDTPYGMTLNVIIQRLENKWYRRIKSVHFDLKVMRKNIADSKLDHILKRKAGIVLQVIQQFIDQPDCRDILQILNKSLPHDDLSSNCDITSDTSIQKNASKCMKKKRHASETLSDSAAAEIHSESGEYSCIWRDDCLKLIADVCQEPFAKPFIEPVNLEDFPDYKNFITDPIDLKTMKHRLETGQYSRPEDMKKDIWQLISNSRHYNLKKNTPIYQFTTSLENYLNERMTVIIHDFLDTVRLEKKARRRV
ncbi:bromodomain and WD repeat-containing protein 3-like protein [Leptotrombidium deliense]|uniref:Bromodomain and WD repeat-containing protein 3-like protein n=1 Tax=Leptotrombidium deliense TaxID=299467 RepID=A0A443SIY8_9ACAR|nr:bromodomain and WD repeat-containing protein 3-like protein [Leptotrombidium deliense]